MKQAENYNIKIISSINDIHFDNWDTYANPEKSLFNPFISHAFLSALELSECVGPHAGWLPNHLVLLDENETELGYLPCYIKLHSRGEFVFDHSWASAYDRVGKVYYPKLQCAVPFTPVSTPKILVKQDRKREDYQRLLLSGAVQLLEKYEASTIHLTFLNKDERELLSEMGFLFRKDHQFHWINNEYDTFDDFLQTLSSRKRKTIRKERKEALIDGMEIKWFSGDDLKEDHWDAFFNFYMDTSDRKWGIPYLNRKFFEIINQTMKEHILLILCYRNGKPIAGALNFIGGDCLYGRYWGAVENHKYLHFEVCYYQAIDFAIQNGLKRVEAGAQGEHKIARGYLPETTYSAHYIHDTYMRAAIANFLNEEGKYIEMETEELCSRTPYSKK